MLKSSIVHVCLVSSCTQTYILNTNHILESSIVHVCLVPSCTQTNDDNVSYSELMHDLLIEKKKKRMYKTQCQSDPFTIIGIDQVQADHTSQDHFCSISHEFIYQKLGLNLY